MKLCQFLTLPNKPRSFNPRQQSPLPDDPHERHTHRHVLTFDIVGGWESLIASHRFTTPSSPCASHRFTTPFSRRDFPPNLQGGKCDVDVSQVRITVIDSTDSMSPCDGFNASWKTYAYYYWCRDSAVSCVSGGSHQDGWMITVNGWHKGGIASTRACSSMLHVTGTSCCLLIIKDATGFTSAAMPSHALHEKIEPCCCPCRHDSSTPYR